MTDNGDKAKGKNRAAQAMARKRWRKVSPAERQRIARELGLASAAARKAKSAPKEL